MPKASHTTRSDGQPLDERTIQNPDPKGRPHPRITVNYDKRPDIERSPRPADREQVPWSLDPLESPGTEIVEPEARADRDLFDS